MTTDKSMWRDAAIWALLAALLLEFGINGFARRTLWHRVTALEQRVTELENK